MSDRPPSNGSSKSKSNSNSRGKTQTQTQTKRKRCPKGTRRNKDGDCVPLSVFQAEQKTQSRKRCPKGTRRNEAGDCVPSSGAVATSRVESKPMLKGNSELVQFSFNDAQLATFQPMVSDSPTSALSWLNVIYALRLIDTKRMEKEVAENGNSTMSSEYAKWNIQDMFSKVTFKRNHIMDRYNNDLICYEISMRMIIL